MVHAVPACIWQVEGFATCLSLKDLCILSQTCKDWQEAVLALYSGPQIKQLTDALLASVPELAKALAKHDRLNKQLHQLWRLVSLLQIIQPWGPALAATPGLLVDLTQMHTVSHLPWKLVRYCVQHQGVTITYQQLVTAAYNRVTGVEMWVQEQQCDGRQSDIPDIIAELCCGYPSTEGWQWLRHGQPTSTSTIVDMTQIFFNFSPCRSATIAEMLISKIQNATTVLQLLPTAAARGHHHFVRAVLHTPAIQQSTPAAVLQLMQADVAVGRVSHTTASILRGDMMSLLVQLPAATSIARTDVMLLLHTALSNGNGAAAAALCTLSTIRTASVRNTVRLLRMAIRASLQGAVAALCSLPAARNINCYEWARLATAALQGKLRRGSAALCKLPAAGHVAHEVIADLLSSTVTYRLYAAANALVALPGADSMPSEQVLQLTRQLVAQTANMSVTDHYRRTSDEYPYHTLELFRRLKAVQDMSSVQLLDCLSSSLQHSNYQLAVWQLSQLPAAHNIPDAVMLQQMQQAVQQQNSNGLSALCSLPAAQHVSANCLLQLLDVASHQDSDTGKDIQKELCRLAVRLQVNSSQLMAVLLAALNCGEPLSSFSRKIAWSRLTTDNVVDLLSAAIQCESPFDVQFLCQLSAANEISCDVLIELIHAALEDNGDRRTLRNLCLLPAVQQLSEDAVAALVSKIEQSGIWRKAQAVQLLKPKRS